LAYSLGCSPIWLVIPGAASQDATCCSISFLQLALLRHGVRATGGPGLPQRLYPSSSPEAKRYTVHVRHLDPSVPKVVDHTQVLQVAKHSLTSQAEQPRKFTCLVRRHRFTAANRSASAGEGRPDQTGVPKDERPPLETPVTETGAGSRLQPGNPPAKLARNGPAPESRGPRSCESESGGLPQTAAMLALVPLPRAPSMRRPPTAPIAARRTPGTW